MGTKNVKAPRRMTPRRALRRIALCAFVALLIYMLAEARIVRLVRTDLPIRGLDPAFDGLKIMYVSDLHMTSDGGVDRTLALFDALKSARPDMLLLGGDYTADDPISLLFDKGESPDRALKRTDLAWRYFDGMKSFATTYGIYAVVGDQDHAMAQTLAEIMPSNGVRMLKNSSILLTKGDSRLALVGLDDWKTGVQSLGHVLDGLRPEDTVVVISHSPEAVKQLFVTNAQASSVVDAALTGHTMGGRFALFGRELFNPLDEKDYGAGWQIMGLNTRVLISRGLKCNWPPLRLGTRPEVHLLTLRAAN